MCADLLTKACDQGLLSWLLVTLAINQPNFNWTGNTVLFKECLCRVLEEVDRSKYERVTELLYNYDENSFRLYLIDQMNKNFPNWKEDTKSGKPILLNQTFEIWSAMQIISLD